MSLSIRLFYGNKIFPAILCTFLIFCQQFVHKLIQSKYIFKKTLKFYLKMSDLMLTSDCLITIFNLIITRNSFINFVEQWFLLEKAKEIIIVNHIMNIYNKLLESNLS